MPMGDRIGHAEILIGNSRIMLADEAPQMDAYGPKHHNGSPISLMLYVDDVDTFTKKAVAAGAEVLRPVKNQFYGDHSGTFLDPFGYKWTIGTHVEDVPAGGNGNAHGERDRGLTGNYHSYIRELPDTRISGNYLIPAIGWVFHEGVFQLASIRTLVLPHTEILQFLQSIVEKGGLSRPPGRHFVALTRMRGRCGRSRRPSQTSELAAFHRSLSPASSTLQGRRGCCNRRHCSCAPTD